MYVKASCEFPYLEKWKMICNNNKVLSILDSVLSGYAQISFSDNSFSGLLLIFATYIASPIQAIVAVWCCFVGNIFAFIIGIHEDLIKTGLYGFNQALVGLAIIPLAFPDSNITMGLIVFATLASIFSVLLTAGFNQYFSRWGVSSFSLPYSVTIFIFIPASIMMSGLNTYAATPTLFDISIFIAQSSWGFIDIFKALINGISQVLWVENSITAVLFLIAVLISSRFDAISTMIGTITGTGVAVLLGFPKEFVMSGIFGYNAILLMMVMTRGFLLNKRSYILSILLAGFSSIISAALKVIFTTIGVSAYTAFPYVIICIIVFIARDHFKGLTYIPPKYWGVPETINKNAKRVKLYN